MSELLCYVPGVYHHLRERGKMDNYGSYKLCRTNPWPPAHLIPLCVHNYSDSPMSLCMVMLMKDIIYTGEGAENAKVTLTQNDCLVVEGTNYRRGFVAACVIWNQHQFSVHAHSPML